MSNMLLPTELDTAMSPRPLRATITLVIRSGMDVPAAKIVKPMISSLIPMVSPTWKGLSKNRKKKKKHELQSCDGEMLSAVKLLNREYYPWASWLSGRIQSGLENYCFHRKSVGIDKQLLMAQMLPEWSNPVVRTTTAFSTIFHLLSTDLLHPLLQLLK